jgi:hypothetical protein
LDKGASGKGRVLFHRVPWPPQVARTTRFSDTFFQSLRRYGGAGDSSRRRDRVLFRTQA